MKIKLDPISKDDIEAYISDQAGDFAFEMKVVRATRELFVCKHSGMYDDPDTGKSRQFDLQFYSERSLIRRNGNEEAFRSKECIGFAVESKNLADFKPLLISRIGRQNHEANIDLADLDQGTVSSCADSSFYPKNSPVGKSTAQVARLANPENTGRQFSLGRTLAYCRLLQIQGYYV